MHFRGRPVAMPNGSIMQRNTPAIAAKNLLVYPLAWYHGPHFPSQREPSGAADWCVACRSETIHPLDHVAGRLVCNTAGTVSARKGFSFRAR